HARSTRPRRSMQFAFATPKQTPGSLLKSTGGATPKSSAKDDASGSPGFEERHEMQLPVEQPARWRQVDVELLVGHQRLQLRLEEGPLPFGARQEIVRQRHAVADVAAPIHER